MCNNPSNEKIFSATLTVDSNVPGCTWDANQSNRVQARLGRQRQRCRQRFKFYSRGQQTLNATHKRSRNDQDVMQKSQSAKATVPKPRKTDCKTSLSSFGPTRFLICFPFEKGVRCSRSIFQHQFRVKYLSKHFK